MARLSASAMVPDVSIPDDSDRSILQVLVVSGSVPDGIGSVRKP